MKSRNILKLGQMATVLMLGLVFATPSMAAAADPSLEDLKTEWRALNKRRQQLTDKRYSLLDQLKKEAPADGWQPLPGERHANPEIDRQHREYGAKVMALVKPFDETLAPTNARLFAIKEEIVRRFGSQSDHYGWGITYID